jgi:hypothetical protein
MKKTLFLLTTVFATGLYAALAADGQSHAWNSTNGTGEPRAPRPMERSIGGINSQGRFGSGLIEQGNTINLLLKDITLSAAQIKVGTNVLSFIEFPDDIVQVASARADFLTTTISEVNKSQLMVRGLKSNGSTDLHVTLASGETAMFVVKIDATRSSPIRYVVKGNDAASVTAPVTAPLLASPLAEWFGAKADFNTFENGDVVINYSLFNKSNDSGMVASSTALNFYTLLNGEKKNLEYRITRDSVNGGVISAGKAEYGLIKVFGANTISALTMEWSISNQKNRQKVTYKVEFDLSNGTSR